MGFDQSFPIVQSLYILANFFRGPIAYSCTVIGIVGCGIGMQMSDGGHMHKVLKVGFGAAVTLGAVEVITSLFPYGLG